MDESDEIACKKLILNDGYQKSFAPKTNEKLKILVDIHIDNVLDLDEGRSAMTLKFKMVVEWMDSRLKFINLKEDNFSNILTAEETEQIWMPVLTFVNTEHQNEAHFNNGSSFNTIKIDPGAKAYLTGYDELRNGKLFNGKDWARAF